MVGDRSAREGTGAHVLHALALTTTLVAAPPCRAAGVPQAQALPLAVDHGKDISLNAELPGDGKLVRSVRLSKLAASGTLTLKLLPSDLISANSDRIERTAITLGALQPLGDFSQETLVAGGVVADVSSRTIATFKGPTPG